MKITNAIDKMVLAGVFSSALPAHAIDTDPLDYVAPKPGVSVLGLYYGDWSSNIQRANGAAAAANTIDLNYGVATFVKFFDLAGYVAGAKIVLPATNLRVTATGGVTSSGSGLGDPTLVFPVWLVNKPESRTYFAVTPRLQLPLGSYDKNKISPGANRWTFALQPGFTTGLSDKWSLDLVGDVQVFGKNDDIVGGGSSKQKALYSLQTHLTYTLHPGLNVSIGAYKYVGGETSTRGVSNKDRVNTTTVIAGFDDWITKSDNLSFQYRTDTSVRNGAEFDGFQFRYLHAF